MNRTTVITPEQIAANRQALSEWIESNGIDPHDVPDSEPIAIRHRWLRGPVIRCRAYHRDGTRRTLIDPDGIKPWTVRTTVPCVVPLPKLSQPAAEAPR